MLHFISWKLRKLLNIFKSEGHENGFGFVYHKVQDRLNSTANAVVRSLKEAHLRQEFQALWQAHAKSNHPRRVLLLVATFFDLDGKEYMQGGAERYICELHQLITSLGGELEVYQCARSNWYNNSIHGIPVYGLNTTGFNQGLLNRAFHTWVQPGCLTIYFQMLLSTPLCHQPSICVSHGVDWDAHWLQSNPIKHRSWIRTILSSIKNVDRMVSVDTNTINWLRATDVLKAEKCVYIPNFVDTRQFKPQGTGTRDDKIVILYPRRLSEARGFWLMAGVLPALFDRFSNLEFRFCGISESYEQFEIKKLCQQYPGRVLWYDRPPEEMPDEYQNADIVVIPTMYSEGTSLSCLEALASRRAVIATNVGGLPDLILPEFNGLLIEPNEAALLDALCRLIADPQLRQKLAQNGYQTAQEFNLSVWRKRWESVLRPHLGLS